MPQPVKADARAVDRGIIADPVERNGREKQRANSRNEPLFGGRNPPYLVKSNNGSKTKAQRNCDG